MRLIAEFAQSLGRAAVAGADAPLAGSNVPDNGAGEVVCCPTTENAPPAGEAPGGLATVTGLMLNEAPGVNAAGLALDMLVPGTVGLLPDDVIDDAAVPAAGKNEKPDVFGAVKLNVAGLGPSSGDDAPAALPRKPFIGRPVVLAMRPAPGVGWF